MDNLNILVASNDGSPACCSIFLTHPLSHSTSCINNTCFLSLFDPFISFTTCRQDLLTCSSFFVSLSPNKKYTMNPASNQEFIHVKRKRGKSATLNFRHNVDSSESLRSLGLNSNSKLQDTFCLTNDDIIK